jgi:hypothetical protein
MEENLPCVLTFHNTDGAYYKRTIRFIDLPPTSNEDSWRNLIKFIIPDEYEIALSNEFSGTGIAGTNLIIKHISMNTTDEADPLTEAHRQSFRNFHFISYMHKVGCFTCLSVVESKDVNSWILDGDGSLGKTAICPACLSDTLIFSTDIAFLKTMKDYWLG